MFVLPDRRNKLLLSTVSVSAIFLLLFSATPQNDQQETTIKTLHLHKHYEVSRTICDGTLYPDLCVSTLSTFPDLTSKTIPQIISAIINHTMDMVKLSDSNCSSLRKKLRKADIRERIALDDCKELFSKTLDQLRTTVSDLSPKSLSNHSRDLQTLLSAAITNQYTCLDGFAYSNGSVRSRIEKGLYRISHLVSNSLAMLKKIPASDGFSDSVKLRRVQDVFPEYGRIKDGFPAWMSAGDRKLLQTTVSNGTQVDLVVAKDGSGNYTTISEAVAAAPSSSTKRFVIYIKAGSYFENVEVNSTKANLMFIGDGIGKTAVKADRNVVDGWTTFRSATVAVVGPRFIAVNMTFENYAGPSKHQAVALRSGSDFSAFYECSFIGYQDTLYMHSLRQFYKNCDIYGTIDFVFGNAAAVLQDCSLYARKPDPNQKNLFTAQGREDPNQNTGISIQSCKITAAADLIPVVSQFENYLGRPWKQYSRTVILQSYIGDLIDPAGWLEWSGDFALSTLYYGEYANRGPGSNTSKRVTWPGYTVITNSTVASQFTVGNFIQGNDWIPSEIVPFRLGLS